jgi:hypothetical protein
MAYGTVKVDQITTSTQTLNVDSLVTTSGLSSYAPLSSPDFTTDVTLLAQAPLKFADADSSHWVAFRAPSSVSANVTWTLPAADGSAGQVLSTDGGGTLSWATASSGGASIGIAIALA